MRSDSAPETRAKALIPELQLRVVREEHGGQREGAGRPIYFTARAFIRVCRMIQRGESAVEACYRQGITYEGFRKRVRKDPKFQLRLRQAEEIREHYLREFHIANLLKHSAKNVAASMFWLERRFPNEFALRTVVRSSGDAGSAAVFDKIPLEQLVENARLAAQIAAQPPSGLAVPSHPALNLP